MSTMHRCHLWIALLLCTMLLSCSVSELAGNSSDTQNGVTVIACNGSLEGSAPSGTQLELYPVTHNPVTDSAASITGRIAAASNDSFRFESISDGNYNLLCTKPAGENMLFLKSITIAPGTVDTLHGTLEPPGDILGMEGQTASSDSVTWHVLIMGSPFQAAVSREGNFNLAGLPAGTHRLDLLGVSMVTENTTSLDINLDIRVVPDSSVVLQEW
ncbi:MAG: hypothetical protein GF401_03690 [Chitinivibrionales bacterium]|nr:hypothetical protein [Chitinivibrionales bacterium]